MMMMLAALTASAKGDWKGKVVDEKNQPIEFANVVVLSKVDSTVLCGTVTAEDGTFNIVTKENDGIMMSPSWATRRCTSLPWTVP